jgi:phenylacetate-CoA oxygenase PaaJ subunit
VVNATADTLQREAVIWQTLAAVPDPEIPVISIVDLGIVRSVEWQHGELVVTVTPTYSGCPATEVIRTDIARALTDAGFPGHRLEIRLAPAWRACPFRARAAARRTPASCRASARRPARRSTVATLAWNRSTTSNRTD